MVLLAFQVFVFGGALWHLAMRGLLTISIGVMVSPEPEAVELLRRYNTALNYAINRILRLNMRSSGGFIMLYIES
jgi:hypothetical protein